jgi:hypothetical protein
MGCPDGDGVQDDGGAVGDGEFVVAGGQAAPLLDGVESVGFPRNRGGFLYAASGWMAAIFSYSTGGSNPAELWRRRVL